MTYLGDCSPFLIPEHTCELLFRLSHVSEMFLEPPLANLSVTLSRSARLVA